MSRQKHLCDWLYPKHGLCLQPRLSPSFSAVLSWTGQREVKPPPIITMGSQATSEGHHPTRVSQTQQGRKRLAVPRAKEAQSQKHRLPLGAHLLLQTSSQSECSSPEHPAMASVSLARACGVMQHCLTSNRCWPGPKQTSRGVFCPCFECPCYSVLLFTGQ